MPRTWPTSLLVQALFFKAMVKIEKNCLSSSYNNNVLKLCITSLDIVIHKKIWQPNIRK